MLAGTRRSTRPPTRGYAQTDVLPNESADAVQDRVHVFVTSLGVETTLERLIATDADDHYPRDD
jgi:hypothetical protein